MHIIKTHPSWPQHADFRCPECNATLQEDGEYFDFKNERSTLPCPCCGEMLAIERDVTVSYAVTVTR